MPVERASLRSGAARSTARQWRSPWTGSMNLLRHSGGLRKRIVIVGTGAGGLAAALELAASGFEVIAIERDSEPGGKLKPASVGGVAFDVGPTVFTMRWVFEELFAAVGEDLAAHIPMQPVEILARHAWPRAARSVCRSRAHSRGDRRFRRGRGGAGVRALPRRSAGDLPIGRAALHPGGSPKLAGIDPPPRPRRAADQALHHAVA